MIEAEQILINYQNVLARISIAARSVNRNPDDIKLVLVTKGHPIETIRQAISVGFQTFGENYIEEGILKIEALRGEPELEWHMIGHVQSRKAQLVCEYFQVVHSLDSYKLASRLNSFAYNLGIRLPVMIECNTSGETSKFGFPLWENDQKQELLEEINKISSLMNLDICGLMTMAPYLSHKQLARPYFKRLKTLRDFLQQECPKVQWRALSMGMSDDFEIAIEEGATIVRIGTAILGPRL